MKKTELCITALLMSSFSAPSFAQVSELAGGKNAVRHTIIAQSGSAAPSGGNFLSFSFANATINSRNDVAFDAIVSGPPATTGVFVGDGRRSSTIALGTDSNPNGQDFVFNPFITSNGDVVFDFNFSSIFNSNGREIVPLVQAGDAAPGGGTMTPAGSRAVNDRGEVAYLANVSGSAATRGVFRTDRKETVAIARDDISPPTGGSFVFFANTVMNDRGQVAFFSEMSGGSADFGVFRGDDKGLTPVFVTNQAAPGGGIFADFGNPVINKHGEVASYASLTNSTGNIGLFVGDGRNEVAIALEGQPAPKGGNYGDGVGRFSFLGPARFNDRGEAAFSSILSGGTSTRGLFRGNGKRTTTIALGGATASGTTGTFASFDDFQVGNDGRVAFVATLVIGVGGVDASNNRGIWIGTSDDDIRLVARTGETIGGKELTRLPQFGQGNQFNMNESSVVWVGDFGPTKAVVLTRTQ